MAKNVKDYIPARNGEKGVWAKNLKQTIPSKGPLVGESAADVTAVEDAAQGIMDAVNNLNKAKADYEAAVTNSKQALKAHIKVVRRHAQRMKTHSAYTNAIGLGLGIISGSYNIDIASSKPVLKMSKVPSGYAFKFNLLGFFDAINIYRKRPGDLKFIFLDRKSKSPFIDKEPMIEGTEYSAYFVLHDKEVGKESDVVEINL
jgi:hypothetical protein